jgi:hypothetical protein
MAVVVSILTAIYHMLKDGTIVSDVAQIGQLSMQPIPRRSGLVEKMPTLILTT